MILSSETPAPADLDGKLISIDDSTYVINTAEPEDIEEAENTAKKNDANGRK